jgi:hypothetical protein
MSSHWHTKPVRVVVINSFLRCALAIDILFLNLSLLIFFLALANLAICSDKTVIFSTLGNLTCDDMNNGHINSQNCTVLQEALFDDCCVAEGDSSTTFVTYPSLPEIPNNSYPSCSICFDGSIPIDTYVVYMLLVSLVLCLKVRQANIFVLNYSVITS